MRLEGILIRCTFLEDEQWLRRQGGRLIATRKILTANPKTGVRDLGRRISFSTAGEIRKEVLAELGFPPKRSLLVREGGTAQQQSIAQT